MEEQEPKAEVESGHQSKPEGLLYHYTDQTGLVGILSSGCMWATHSEFLNDLSERRHGLTILCAAINKIGQENSLGVSRVNLDAFRDALMQTLRNYFEATSAFFISFTTDNPHEIEQHKSGSDRLSQWRGYTLGRQGYCLVFNFEVVEEIGNHLHESIKLSGWLKDCIYEEKKKFDLAEAVVRPVFDAYVQEIDKAPRTCISIQPFNDLSGEAMKAFKGVNMNALFLYNILKDSSFDEEREYRLSVTFVNEVSDSSLIKFRSEKVPYIEIPMGIRKPISSLQKIVVGPSSDKEQVVARLRIELDQMGLVGVEVVPSKIPYRNW